MVLRAVFHQELAISCPTILVSVSSRPALITAGLLDWYLTSIGKLFRLSPLRSSHLPRLRSVWACFNHCA